MMVFHWTRPCKRPFESRVGCESSGIVEKRPESVQNALAGRHTYREDVMTSPIRCRVGDILCTVSHGSNTTSPKPLTDKQHCKETSR